jgi:hypothetical protein
MENLDKCNLYDFLFELPLYTKLIIPKTEERVLMEIFKWQSARVDGYNPKIKEMTTFDIEITNETGLYGHNPIHFLGYCKFKMTCVRTVDSMRVYSAMTFNEGTQTYTLFKVGQHPSIADIHISKVRQYDKVLDNDKIKELTRAIGIAANGVGIGSFVYLRRVFEHLIDKAHALALNDTNWNEEKYNGSRMIEKIGLLKNYLPQFLVEHKEMYGILSKGIHELTEDECLAAFEPMKLGIEIILDAKVDEYDRQQKETMASQRIRELNSKFGKSESK